MHLFLFVTDLSAVIHEAVGGVWVQGPGRGCFIQKSVVSVGRSGRGRGEGRGEAGIEAYYSPSMVEDPWRSLRQPQDSAPQQKGDKHLTEGRPSPVVQEAKEADAARVRFSGFVNFILTCLAVRACY